MVAFLGEKYSGKTIACALIKEALTRHYEKYTQLILKPSNTS